MLTQDRHHLIMSKVNAEERVTIDALVAELQVSRETVRRDIIKLEAQRQLRRLHGGVEKLQDLKEAPIESRKASNAVAKRRIALAAARLIKPGMMLAVDAGSTTLAFANAIAPIPDICVVSNSCELLGLIASQQPGADLIQIGGRVAAHLPGTFGSTAVKQISHFAPDFAVFSPVGFSPTRGATYFHASEANFATAMVEASAKTMVLLDSTKLGHISRVEACPTDAVHTLITDTDADETHLSELRATALASIVQA